MRPELPEQETKSRSVTVRINPDGYQAIADRAGRADVEIAVMHRRMLAYAAAHMPEHWTPQRSTK